MAIELVVSADNRVLVDNLEGITEDKEVVFEFKLEKSFIFAHYCDETHVFVFVRGVDDSMYEAIRHIIVFGLHRVSDVVRLEVKPVVAEVQHTDVFALLHLPDFKAELRDFFGEVIQSLKSLLFLLLLHPLLCVEFHLILKLVVHFTLGLIGTSEVKVVHLRSLLGELVISVEI